VPTCFVIMPITPPASLVSSYSGGAAHFQHVYKHIFEPALKHVGFEVVPPFAEGGDLIHAEIIRNLEEADLVLCDLSTANPNVFFELGIRTSLDRPVCLVRDNVSEIVPFDTSMINCYTYDPSLAAYIIEDVVKAVATHVEVTVRRAKGRNSLWRYFGLTQRAKPPIEDNPLEAKINLLIDRATAGRVGPRVYNPRDLEPYAHSIALDEFEFTHELPPEQLALIRKLRLAAENRGLAVEFSIDTNSRKRITLVGPKIGDRDLVETIRRLQEIDIPVDSWNPTKNESPRPYPC
jgi:hypothetical protein